MEKKSRFLDIIGIIIVLSIAIIVTLLCTWLFANSLIAFN